jgi:hypothetical protein
MAWRSEATCPEYIKWDGWARDNAMWNGECNVARCVCKYDLDEILMGRSV